MLEQPSCCQTNRDIGLSRMSVPKYCRANTMPDVRGFAIWVNSGWPSYSSPSDASRGAVVRRWRWGPEWQCRAEGQEE